MDRFFRRWRYPTHCYAICAVARSGSHLLSDGLRDTRRAGRPKRFFCEQLEQKFGDQYGLDPIRDYAGYVRGIIAVVSTPNAVFGFKLMGWDVERLVARLRQTSESGASNAAAIELLRLAFPRLQFIQLSRRDKLRQAISHARALQTGLWKVGNGKAPIGEAKFDANQIAHCIESARIEEKIWSDFFAKNKVEPLRLTYEELCRDYKGTVKAVLEFLHIRLPRKMAISDPTTVRQTDAVTSEWEERYRALSAASVAIS
jgi:LPS sulfotransferase NodH